MKKKDILPDLNIKEALLTINRYSRPGKKHKGPIKVIAIHWVAMPGMSAIQIRNYFEGLPMKKRFAGTQLTIGLKGEIVRQIPDDEMAYHLGGRRVSYTAKALKRLGWNPNKNTIGIEVCHTDWSGKPTKKTWDSLILLSAQLLVKHNLTTEFLWLHHTVNKKDCHHYFVKNPAEWQRLKDEINAYLESINWMYEVSNSKWINGSL